MSAYEAIMKKEGLGDFQRLIERWENLSCNISSLPKGAPVILPDIFLVSPSGSGRTMILNLLSDYLDEKGNLLDFLGGVKYFEFDLSYCAPSAQFAEISRFAREVENAAGFRSDFRGVIFIDVDEWRGHPEEKYFTSFLQYLADNSDDWLIVFSVSDSTQDSEAEQLRSVISSFLRIEKVTIEPPTCGMLMQYLEERLSMCGLTLADGAREVLSRSVEILKGTKYFDGFKTVKLLAADVIYSVYSEEAGTFGEVSAQSVAKFRRDGEYIRVMCNKLERPVIGF